jgi:hypothetical protein
LEKDNGRPQETPNGPVYQEAYPNKADAIEALADWQKQDPAYKLVETEMTEEDTLKLEAEIGSQRSVTRTGLGVVRASSYFILDRRTSY